MPAASKTRLGAFDPFFQILVEYLNVFPKYPLLTASVCLYEKVVMLSLVWRMSMLQWTSYPAIDVFVKVTSYIHVVLLDWRLGWCDWESDAFECRADDWCAAGADDVGLCGGEFRDAVAIGAFKLSNTASEYFKRSFGVRRSACFDS
jgi:hypothetical protein